ncbi:AbrB/MazE/SpoVT family DNA-binding domain-containing protein [Clostridium estertheticum]|uniref:AbrB family transcriptional regulator n=1 Tax=Clostridium estertheticum subsp. estertheticum TaxID=1552 RepID=A0A1J0GI84_9CLOT|nr:AbrB/MazE/SpoVT family DNA-binding domain-containing protein [Clostridium estertheticum]APC41090.1 AbrB family transcriptional regulator [Clostridium estertheticum subsp. estertheticum]MBZ9615333.1 AbrB/MazE/SpoVT family DNA-binding domain-containing protein [Clostridium estertheticum subsp. laramiense]MCB2309018.1 AbrB/MazE/SpoVT family DNA-binding domain-containing protein [Clostridium estertheticum]MCB2346848.1 AbrB/MazE/SpoVT family DNA-binding domain-containing protein [Clostridium este
MKSTGIVRKVDELGRVVIPIELRRTLGIAIKDALEIYTEDDTIILKKYTPDCILCGENNNDLVNYKGKNICKSCLKDIGKSKLL